ncbi:4-alpha-glucanotransferase [Ruegeria sp. 2012CJ41-6]|uniref:4-alpha-glucanotransferase n=1 Tax=Ruegeria spongiae TaxID=2942209 RepID=A0ABT0Q4S3_9RHOB|nr:4-alpha-glucanotransferase [Ruegeria spongiae]MCL6284607.1 4-alpha-glucanotransferase [Ruegeria spongiae]
MSQTDTDLRDLARAHGVHTEYTDLQGQQHLAGPDTLRALLRALGVEIGSESKLSEALHHTRNESSHRQLPREHIVEAEQPNSLPLRTPCQWCVTSETGSVLAEGRADGVLNLPGLPIGYHQLHTTFADHRETTRILARPARAPDLRSRTARHRSWGMTGALYGLRSAENGGLGNYSDLSAAASSLGAMGAQFFGINPVHALGWADSEIISPYSPSHRGFFNTDHIAIQGGLGPTPKGPLVGYAAFRKLHAAALEQAYAAFKTHADKSAFLDWQRQAGPELADFACFEALSETCGPDFRTWPQNLRQPGAEAKMAAGERSEFHAWLQWQADGQIGTAQQAAQDAGMSLGLYLDLAVGPRPDGAEVWMNAATIARGVTIGAPPDHLSPEGQSWALAAHAPGPLAAANYAPFRAMLRKLMGTCGLLRIDHALGLARSYWLPDDGSAGGYVSQPFKSLLAVIQIEAARAGCVVIGEDLGLVPAGFRDQMNATGLYSYAVWQFETRSDGAILPAGSLAPYGLACFGTHDTPTLSGFWHGTDIEWWRRVGWLDDSGRGRHHAHRARQRGSLRKLCGIAPEARLADIIDKVHTQLATAPSELVSVQLDDALAVTEAQNLPGTIDAHPNWRRRLPIPVEGFAASRALRHVADTMNTSRPTEPVRQKEEAPT